ncbi:MAG TPA: hypothetical protein VFY61_09935 [Pyrinomonadaceae bacterium]|nr:hypothetical protein [Pyrinomonadaceae bacterium]
MSQQPEASKPWVIVRVFGLLGLMLALGYFVEGLTLSIRVYRGLSHPDFRTLTYRFVIISLDFFFTLVLVIAAVGLLFAQRWAKKMWLITMSILAVWHVILAAFYQLGRGVDTIFLMWTWAVLLLTAVSWWYFTRRSLLS